MPVALIGLIGYIAILGSLLAPEGETSRFATMAFTLVGFGFSAYLTYRELFSIHAICEWCVSSAVIMTVLMGLSVWRFLRGDDRLRLAERAPARSPHPAAPLGERAPRRPTPAAPPGRGRGCEHRGSPHAAGQSVQWPAGLARATGSARPTW